MCVCIRVAMNVLNFKQVFGIRHVPESYPADIHVKLGIFDKETELENGVT